MSYKEVRNIGVLFFNLVWIFEKNALFLPWILKKNESFLVWIMKKNYINRHIDKELENWAFSADRKHAGSSRYIHS